MTDGSPQYDAWFRMKVQEALADNRPGCRIGGSWTRSRY